jgi:hypothetical protein
VSSVTLASPPQATRASARTTTARAIKIFFMIFLLYKINFELRNSCKYFSTIKRLCQGKKRFKMHFHQKRTNQTAIYIQTAQKSRPAMRGGKG